MIFILGAWLCTNIRPIGNLTACSSRRVRQSWSSQWFVQRSSSLQGMENFGRGLCNIAGQQEVVYSVCSRNSSALFFLWQTLWPYLNRAGGSREVTSSETLSNFLDFLAYLSANHVLLPETFSVLLKALDSRVSNFPMLIDRFDRHSENHDLRFSKTRTHRKFDPKFCDF